MLKLLGFTHPKNNKQLNFKSDLPEDFKKMLDFLKKILKVEKKKLIYNSFI